MDKGKHKRLFLEDIPYNLSIYREVSRGKGGFKGILHIHEVFELLLILSDGANLQLDSEVYPVPKNTLLMFTPGDLHRMITKAGVDYDRYVLYLVPEQADAFSTEQTNLLECFYRRPVERAQILPLSQEQIDVLLPLFCQLDEVQAHQEPMLGDDLLKRFLLCQILIYANRYYRAHNGLTDLQTGSDFRVVNTVLRYIGDHYTEPITLSDLAQTVYLSTHYLCRLFKQVIGTSPMEYVANLRMTKAKELLIQGLSVEQTCERVGYGNLSHFSRQFRQKVGMSPRQYITLNRPKQG